MDVGGDSASPGVSSESISAVHHGTVRVSPGCFSVKYGNFVKWKVEKMRIPKSLILVCLLCSSGARADIIWVWSFGTEAGTMITDGTFADTMGNFTFTILSFEVTASQIPANVGATYIETQPTQGFIWDGNAPTQFFRSNGVFTNGSNFFTEDFVFSYQLAPPPISSRLSTDAATTTLSSGLIVLVPSNETIFSDGFEAVPKLVFATSSLYNGDLKTAGGGATGVEGADNLCNQHAQDAGLPGTYTAWISDRPLNARERISQGNGPYYLPDESGNFAEKVADDLDDILNCDPTCLDSFINRNEDGESVGNPAWTGTRENGNSFGFSSDTACQGWTDGVGDGSGVNGSAAVGRGRFGRLDRINGAWTSNAFFGCQNELRVYCFQD